MGSFVWPALLGEDAVLNCLSRYPKKPEDSGLAKLSGGVHEQPT